MKKYNIFCPKCLDNNLTIPMANLHCPNCHVSYIILADGLIEPGNDKYEFSVCPQCGGRYVFHSFMVPDGLDDVAWDSDEWCENPQCPSNLPQKVVKT